MEHRIKLPPLEESVPLGDGEVDSYSSAAATLVTTDDETQPGNGGGVATSSDEIKDDDGSSSEQFRVTSSPETVPDDNNMAICSDAPAPPRLITGTGGMATCPEPSAPRVITSMGSFEYGNFEASDFVLKVYALNRQGRQLVNSFSLVPRMNTKRFLATPIFELPAGEQLRSRSGHESHVLGLDMTAEGLDEEIEARLLEIGRPLPCEVS